jgi:hypothetical protein
MMWPARRNKAEVLPGLLLIRLAFVSAFACLPGWALNPERLISQYAHSAWRVQDGFVTGFPESLAQTTDGYLWIGTTAGLIRFDGVRFLPFRPPPGEDLGNPSPDKLFGDGGTDRSDS